jgi:hypothetical protein
MSKRCVASEKGDVVADAAPDSESGKSLMKLEIFGTNSYAPIPATDDCRGDVELFILTVNGERHCFLDQPGNPPFSPCQTAARQQVVSNSDICRHIGGKQGRGKSRLLLFARVYLSIATHAALPSFASRPNRTAPVSIADALARAPLALAALAARAP